MEQCVFCIFIDYRGHHRKYVAVYNADWVNLQQKLWFQWIKMYFWKLKIVSSKKNSIVWLHFYHVKKSVDLLRAAPYMLTLVLHKDAPFHWNKFVLSMRPNSCQRRIFVFITWLSQDLMEFLNSSILCLVAFIILLMFFYY